MERTSEFLENINKLLKGKHFEYEGEILKYYVGDDYQIVYIGSEPKVFEYLCFIQNLLIAEQNLIREG